MLVRAIFDNMSVTATAYRYRLLIHVSVQLQRRGKRVSNSGGFDIKKRYSKTRRKGTTLHGEGYCGL